MATLGTDRLRDVYPPLSMHYNEEFPQVPNPYDTDQFFSHYYGLRVQSSYLLV
jgi:hypothetical protein